MDRPTRLEDLCAADLKAALAASCDSLTDDQLLAITAFIDRVGGVQNARHAVEMLSRMEAA